MVAGLRNKPLEYSLSFPDIGGRALPAPQEVLNLVARFEEQFDSYKSASYNETALRREFLDPLVYEFNGLTDEEIRIVEEATAQ